MTQWDARVGDEVAIESHRLHGGRRSGTIVEVLGPPGAQYYRVRWQDGRESVFHPGPDAVLRPSDPRRAAARRPASGQAAAPKPAAPVVPAPRPAQRAEVGDRLVIRGHRLGEPERDAEILAVRGPDGGPPYLVRWSDTGREGLIFPGSDAVVERLKRRRRRAESPARRAPGRAG